MNARTLGKNWNKGISLSLWLTVATPFVSWRLEFHYRRWRREEIREKIAARSPTRQFPTMYTFAGKCIGEQYIDNFPGRFDFGHGGHYWRHGWNRCLWRDHPPSHLLATRPHDWLSNTSTHLFLHVCYWYFVLSTWKTARLCTRWWSWHELQPRWASCSLLMDQTND